jgi:hypothetical protein
MLFAALPNGLIRTVTPAVRPTMISTAEPTSGTDPTTDGSGGTPDGLAMQIPTSPITPYRGTVSMPIGPTPPTTTPTGPVGTIISTPPPSCPDQTSWDDASQSCLPVAPSPLTTTQTPVTTPVDTATSTGPAAVTCPDGYFFTGSSCLPMTDVPQPMSLGMKIAIGIGVAAALAGGGFLIYRSRKKAA